MQQPAASGAEKINWEYWSQIQPVIELQEHLLIGQIPPLLAFSLVINLTQLCSISTRLKCWRISEDSLSLSSNTGNNGECFQAFIQRLLIVCLAEQLLSLIGQFTIYITTIVFPREIIIAEKEV